MSLKQGSQPQSETADLSWDTSNIISIGLSSIPSRSPSEPFVDIVFVHGLWGHPRETWESTTGDLFWPSAFLARDVNNARLFTYGYSTGVAIASLQSSNSNNFYSAATKMTEELERELQDHNVPIVFIAHSLGGLMAINLSDFLRNRTKLVMFFGTPNGSSDIIHILRSFNTNDSLVKSLNHNGQTLDRIHRDFVKNNLSNSIRIHSFQESKMIGGSGVNIFKDSTSRVVGELETIEYIDADHRNMAKFRQDTDAGYIAVRGILQSFIKQNVQVSATSAQATSSHLTPLHYQPMDSTISPATPFDDDSGNIQNLSSGSPAAHYDSADKFPGTCKWIVQQPEFEEWSRFQEPSAPLLISGSPHTGKTAISLFLLDHFRDIVPSHKTVCFFFNNRDVKRSRATNLLKDVIHQLIRHSADLYQKYVEPKIKAIMASEQDFYNSFELLWDAFFEMTQDPALGPTVCVVDALDECEEGSRLELISRIVKNFALPRPTETSAQRSKTFKLLLTSRPLPYDVVHWSRVHIIHLSGEEENPGIDNTPAHPPTETLDESNPDGDTPVS